MSQEKDPTNKKEQIAEIEAYKFALDASAIVSITDTKGTIKYVNETFCDISKYTKEELIGQNQRIVSSGYHSIDFWKNMWATIGKGKVWKADIRNKTKDGEIYWVATTIVPFMNENNKPYQYLSIRQDITKQKQLEQNTINSILFSLEEDREYFSEDLHEGLAQTLTGLKFLMNTIENKTKSYNNDSLDEDIKSIKSYIQKSIESTKNMALDLMPRTLMQYGFISALEDEVLKAESNELATIQLEFDENEIQLDKSVSVTLYRTVMAVIYWANEFSNLESIDIQILSNPNFEIDLRLNGITILNSWNEQPPTVFVKKIKQLEKRIQLLGGQVSVMESEKHNTTRFEIFFEEIPHSN